jgi:hypothetical protein
MFCVFLVIWLFKQVLFNFVAKTFMDNPKSSQVIPVKSKAKHRNSGDYVVNSFVSAKALCDSYKIENNPDYVEVLEIMRKKRKFIIKVKGFPKTAS